MGHRFRLGLGAVLLAATAAGGAAVAGAGPAQAAPAARHAVYVNETRNVPPSRASNSCTSLVMPSGTRQWAWSTWR